MSSTQAEHLRMESSLAIPTEILAVLPTGSEAVLELAHKLVLHAHTQKVE
jgi:hypothetical protein